jgi:glycosyltransferase involved in cell wall biosynthesis
MSKNRFDVDRHPGRPKILFVGLAESSHTHSWIDLLEGARFNARLFAMPSGVPPREWPVPTYVTAYYHSQPVNDAATRALLYPARPLARFANRSLRRLWRGAEGAGDGAASAWLARVVRRWRPDIVHTLGVEPAGEFYYDVRRKYNLEETPWILQTRGGSDLALTHLDPKRRETLGAILRECDQMLCDNHENFRIAREFGVREEQFSPIAPVPGTGGIDTEALAQLATKAPAQRRVILWPKAYECPWSKALPIFEALKLCWEQIQPCHVEMLALDPETRAWFRTLPEHIRQACRTHERVERERVLEMMAGARVMLAPSLVDGVPNSMYEAMAAGALPIVSPLDTIRPVVEEERNVLFARNLYPQEIADALVRAMTDDALVASAAERNLALVREVADRAQIRSRVVGFYEKLAAEGVGPSDARARGERRNFNAGATN